MNDLTPDAKVLIEKHKWHNNITSPPINNPPVVPSHKKCIISNPRKTTQKNDYKHVQRTQRKKKLDKSQEIMNNRVKYLSEIQ